MKRFITHFKEGKADILIGTQMISKGLDFKNVTLVGILAADMSINIPDYRAAERNFSDNYSGCRKSRTWRKAG